ncbi:glycogen-binding subunit 76A-like, partial [Diaphorina citri]|uniref:Glycogen-binding subunit 76A-like n=1 Tax=Diaphorina citri TaxID=121845 RepID=A0A1S3DQQ0_DIACI
LMSREGLSLDLISEDPSTCAAQFNALSLNCVDSVNNNSVPNHHPPSPQHNDSCGSEYRKLRRSSSLRSGKTPPGTPASKKFVRFADVLGLDLADVRTYLDEIPSVPQSAYEDLVCPQDEDEDEETCNDCDK